MDTFDFTNDPLTAAQVELLGSLLAEQWSEKARDGFLVLSGRFLVEFGNDRTGELGVLYKTDLRKGRVALRRSLEALFDSVGSLAQFERDFTVFINDPDHGSVGVFPQLPMIGIEELAAKLYRVMDSHAAVRGTGEALRDFIMREGRLPYFEPPPPRLVLRQKLHIYWCSYECYESPLATRSALQIVDDFHTNCKLRVTLPTAGLEGSVFVAHNGDTNYADKTPGAFAGYFVELRAQDHPEPPGGGLQIGVVGSPKVRTLEEWSDADGRWCTIWGGEAEP
jgi:hypothetical protein